MNIKYPIWGDTIPFNCDADKLSKMEIDKKADGVIGLLRFIKTRQFKKACPQGQEEFGQLHIFLFYEERSVQ